jgi:RNA polymerase sigma factor (sigma-70 family)
MQTLGVRPMQVVAETARLARECGGCKPVSRQELLRLRFGGGGATSATMRSIVAAMREITGIIVRAADLFDLEPDAPGGAAGVPVSWDGPAVRVRRPFVSQQSGVTATEAFETLYTEYALLLRNIATRRYGIPCDEAEAIVHDIFASYLERRAWIRDERRWLAGAVKNASKYYLRCRRRESPLLAEHDEKADLAAGDRAEQWLTRLTLAAVLARLGTKCREALRMYYLRGHATDDIAHHLDTSADYVRHLLMTCRKRVRDLFFEMTRPKS